MRYVFEGGELDATTIELRVGGEVRQVEPQVFDVLRVLLEHHDRVVSKEELLDAVWHHRFVTESAISSRIKSVRRAVGDDGRAQRLVRTVHSRGYQFVGEVRVEDRSAADTNATGVAATLPVPATRTIGRDADIGAILALLERARIVTLVGPGGVGKTRLAVEAARVWDAAHAVQASFVDLTKVREHQLVADLVVRELGIHLAAAADPTQVITEALRDRPTLFVLDNFEHVVDAAPLVAELVASAPELRVLVTSRARLRISGEHVYDVGPLAVDRPGHGEELADAVALFELAATAADPAFELGRDLEDVVAICNTVDGLPLAIELAAGHVRTLPPALLRSRLTERLGSVAAVARDAPARQQTVPATIDWSLQLLGDSERRVFNRLGVFSGPVALEAIEAVCGFPPVADAVDGLARLVDQSLVRRVMGSHGEARFGLLELLRERARELMDASEDANEVSARHAAYVADFLEDLERRRWGEASDRWIDRITELLAEIRSAYAWANEHGAVEVAARITANLGTYWHREGHHAEGRAWAAEALSHAPELAPELVARLELAAGFVQWPRDQQVAGAHWSRAIDAFRALGDPRYLAYALALQSGTFIGDRAGYERAVALCDEAIELARVVGDRPLIAQALNVNGELARVQGDDELARLAYEEGQRLATEASDRPHLSVFLANLSYLADHRGDHEEARRLGCEALRLCWGDGRRMMAAWTVSELAGPEVGLGRAERGAILVGAADEALRVLGVTRHPGDVPEHELVVDGLRAALGDAELGRLRSEGAKLSLADAVALALSEPPG